MATIIDVAREAHVSHSTVSLVLNNSPLVKKETREHVLQVIDRLHYVPNDSARSLSRRITNSLGIIIMAEESPHTSYDFDQHTGLCSYNISTGIMDGLSDSDYGLITEHFCSINDPDALPKAVLNRRVDGAFIVGSPYSPELFGHLKKIGIPIVAVGVNSFVEGLDSVFADPGEGARLGIEYLLEKGHKKICYINSPRTFHSHDVREQAIRKMEEEGKLKLDAGWMISCEYNHGASSYEAFRTFFDAGNRPDGIVAANGQLALGAMRYLYEQGVRIPDEVSIVAYEDSSLSGYAIPPLTTVNIQKEKMGTEAARCLLERIRNPKKPVEKIVIPSYMVIRDSVKDRR